MIADIHNRTNDVVFRVRLIKPGDKYGRGHSLKNDSGKALIEIYDSAYIFDRDLDGAPLGQFVSRYYVETFESIGYRRGLNMQGDVARWTLDADAVDSIKMLLMNWVK